MCVSPNNFSLPRRQYLKNFACLPSKTLLTVFLGSHYFPTPQRGTLALFKEKSTWVLGPGTPSGASYHHHPCAPLGKFWDDGTIGGGGQPQIARREYTRLCRIVGDSVQCILHMGAGW